MLFFIYAIIGMQVGVFIEAMIFRKWFTIWILQPDCEKQEVQVAETVEISFLPLQVFGNIDLNEDTAINHHNNFRTFLQALMLLFRYEKSYNINLMSTLDHIDQMQFLHENFITWTSRLTDSPVGIYINISILIIQGRTKRLDSRGRCSGVWVG